MSCTAQRFKTVKYIYFHLLLFSLSLSKSDVKDIAFGANVVLYTTSTRVLKSGFSEGCHAPRQTPQQCHLEPQNQRNIQSAELSILLSPHSQTASRNIQNHSFWSQCNLSLTLNLKAPFILFSGEQVQKSTGQIKVRERRTLPTMVIT